MNGKKYNTIIWDWNGTLINDRWLALKVMNGLLSKRDLPGLSTQKYLEIFDFPVKDYYATAGFNFETEPFEIVGSEFIKLYNNQIHECQMHEYAKTTLAHLKSKNLKQFVLSARNQSELEKEFKHYNIEQYFESFSGLSDDYANGKTKLGLQLIKQHKIDKNETVLIGDTVHDFEVAEALGIDCILVEGGHHSAERLKQCNTPVIQDLSQLEI